MRRSGTIDEKTMREFDELMFPTLDSGEGIRRLAALGGSEPKLKSVPRRRSQAKAKRRRPSEHDTQHITPAGRSVRAPDL
jgi:hypothetical protein